MGWAVSNLTYLLDYMATQMHLACPKNLIILTNNMPRQAVEEGAKRAPKGLKINLAKWSLSNMRVAAKISHYALIPSVKNDPRKSGVSPGRLLTSLALGLPVISEDLHSYMPFSKFFAKVGTDDAKNLAQNPSSYHGKVREAQSLIRERNTTSAIENEWVEVANNFLK